ncbi:class I SAM-dependent methyltransferase [Chloroflexota bacterium]|nr:class I SAM-dependent methyltransferase [Chloroflexota bacterium]
MSKFTDQDYLKDDQYHSPDNLNFRIALHELYSTAKVPWTTWIYEHLGMAEDQNVLAVGCGNATQWRDNASRFPDSSRFFLMDLSIGMLRGARREIGEDDPRFNYFSGDAQYLPFDDALFDRVTANHMLYHVPTIELAVAECARVLKPDGLFMAATNGATHMVDLYHLFEEFSPGFRIPDSDRRRFGLQNGQEYLASQFAEVRLDCYQSDLWVTDGQALVNYAFSMWDVEDDITNQKAAEMLAFFNQKIEKDGGIKIRKETGVFLASHQPGVIDSLNILQAEQKLS